MPPVRVLIIDDERLLCWSIEQTLKAAGYKVAVAETASDGIACFRTFEPQVVFLDLRLPDGDGIALLELIKAEKAHETAVVLMSAHAEACTAEQALRLGACNYLKKPFDFDELERVVTLALRACNRDA